MTSPKPESAFILRMTHGRDRIDEALQRGEIVLGWSRARGLLGALDRASFRAILRDTYYSGEPDLRRAGTAAGHAWRFIHEMGPGTWIVVPSAGRFHIAQVTGEAVFDATRVGDDSAYSRPVVWLNEGRSIPRRLAKAALQSRMKAQGTTASATDLISEIADCLEVATRPAGAQPTFGADLRSRLIAATLAELRGGRIDSYGFEQVIAAWLRATGGKAVRIVDRRSDEGADVVATFRVAGALQLRVAVQAKHYGLAAPIGRGVVDQLLAGMDAEEADIGIVASSGMFSDEAVEYVRSLESRGRHVELLDGEDIAALIVDCGLGAVDLDAKSNAADRTLG
jgi:predicted Mrr-cat superfamily restriction endonuclease